MAEIVLTVNIISLIIKCDKKVCEISDSINIISPQINKGFCAARIGINSLNLTLNKVQIKIEQKKDEYKTIIFKYFITSVLFLLLNANGKKIMSGVETAFTVLDLLKKVFKKHKQLEKINFP